MERARRSRPGLGRHDRKVSRSRPQVSPGRRASASQLRRLADDSSVPSRAEIAMVQRVAGNRAVNRLLAPFTVQPKLYVGPADDAYEREADRVAGAVTRAPVSREEAAESGRTPPAAARGRLPDATRDAMEQRFGVDFGHVRVHTGNEAVQLNRAIGAEAVTHGADIWFDSGRFRPRTGAGQELLAHELAHVVQQAGTVGRSVAGEGQVPVKGRAPAGLVSAKRKKMYLDFVRMKRLDAQYDKVIQKKLGMKKLAEKTPEQSGGTYGHWWTELGDLNGKFPGQWKATHSYGWWPANGVGGLGETLTGVPGSLNAGAKEDPHHGETVKQSQMFHPVMSIDPATADYEHVRAKVMKDIRAFAQGYHGTWRWTLGWGQNCHTFQQALKTDVGLHYQKGEGWFTRPNDVESLETASQAEQEKEANEKWNKEHPGTDHKLVIGLPVAADFSGDDRETLPAGSTVRLLDDQMAGDASTLKGWDKCEIGANGRTYFTYYADFRKAAGLPALRG